jgi:hypothetical protein
MPETNEFIYARTIATVAAQKTFESEWLWDEKTVVQWDADIAAYEAQRDVLAACDTTARLAQSRLDVAIDGLHQVTLQGLSMAKTKYRSQPVEAHILRTLTANSVNRGAVMEEALEWEVAWEEIDPAWVPVPGNTLAALAAAQGNCRALIKDLAKQRTIVRRETKRLSQLAEEMDDACVAWYSAAVHVFDVATVAGESIRKLVPTTYSPASAAEKVVAPAP